MNRSEGFVKFPRFVSNIENCRKQEKLMTADIVIPVYRPGAELGESSGCPDDTGREDHSDEYRGSTFPGRASGKIRKCGSSSCDKAGI